MNSKIGQILQVIGNRIEKGIYALLDGEQL